MIRKIALEEHFLNPGLEEYWLPTVAGVDPQVASGLLARLKDFGDMRLQAMDDAGIARSVLSIAGPGVQNERDAATARRRAAEANDFLAREVLQTAGSLFRLWAPAHARCARRGRRTRTLHGRTEILRRHDQRPHQRPISRPSLAASVLGAGRGARGDDLYPSDRPDRAVAGARRRRRLAPRHLGVGLRDRLARAAAGLLRTVRSLPAGEAGARASRRDAAVPAVALRQPRQALRREAAKEAVRLHQAEYRRDHVRHVRRPSRSTARLPRSAKIA